MLELSSPAEGWRSQVVGWFGRLSARVGQRTFDALNYVGEICILLVHTLASVLTPPLRVRQILDQLVRIGWQSVPIAFLISIFTGMVLAFQSAYQMQKFAATMFIPGLVALSLVREIGPVLTALIVAGRSGSAIAAELGTMQVTEQIDALETLATDPVRYLVVPRFVALVVALPMLTLYADAFGIFGGWLIGVFKLNMGADRYWELTRSILTLKDVFSGLIKSVIFAGIIAIVSSFEGFRTQGGAEGVGRSTTMAVVLSFILIIASDCLFTVIFYFS